MSRHKLAIAWLVILVLVVPALATAGRKGRLVGRVVDAEGNPIEGVTVTATSAEVKDFLVTETTDRKGTFIVDFDKVGVTYHYRFDKAGYVTLETDQRWDLEGTARHDFVLYPGTAPSADALIPTESQDPVVAAYNAGVAAFDARDFARAQAKFEEALKTEPELRQAWSALSLAHLEQAHWQQAVEAAEKAIALGATSEQVLRCRWEAYRQLGDEVKTEQALQDLQSFAQITEEAKRIYNEGVVLAESGDHEAAFARFQEALKIDPNLEEALSALATEGLKVKRYQESLAAANLLLEKNPNDDQALRVRYNAALGLGDPEVLVDALVGLAVVEPVIARDGLLHLAYDAYDANDMPRAKAMFQKVLQVDPSQPQSHYVLALICVNDGEKDEAQKHLQRFIELAPNDPEAETARELLGFLSGS